LSNEFASKERNTSTGIGTTKTKNGEISKTFDIIGFISTQEPILETKWNVISWAGRWARWNVTYVRSAFFNFDDIYYFAKPDFKKFQGEKS